MSVGAGNKPFGGALNLNSWQPTSAITGVTHLGGVLAVIPCSAEGVAIADSGVMGVAQHQPRASAQQRWSRPTRSRQRGPRQKKSRFSKAVQWDTPVVDPFGDQYFAMCLAIKVLPTVLAHPAFGSHTMGSPMYGTALCLGCIGVPRSPILLA